MRKRKFWSKIKLGAVSNAVLKQGSVALAASLPVIASPVGAKQFPSPHVIASPAGVKQSSQPEVCFVALVCSSQ